MDNFTAFYPFSHTKSIKYLPLNERIHLVRCYNTLGKIRIGKFVLPFSGNAIFIIPPLQSCTFNVTSTDKILCYSIPLNWLSRRNGQQLLATMYHASLFGINRLLENNTYFAYGGDREEMYMIEAIECALNDTGADIFYTKSLCNKTLYLVYQLLNYIAKHPITLEYFNVFAAAQYLHCSPRTLQRLSNGVFGLSIHEILGHHLAMAGVDRVLYRGENFKEAAKGIGYANPSAYCKCFKGIMKMSPNRFLESITTP